MDRSWFNDVGQNAANSRDQGQTLSQSTADATPPTMSTRRQKVLVLYLANSALDAPVIAWALYDGTGQTFRMAGDEDKAPYATGLAALRASAAAEPGALWIQKPRAAARGSALRWLFVCRWPSARAPRAG